MVTVGKSDVVYMSKPDCTLIVGPSGCGKTYTLLHHIIEGVWWGVRLYHHTLPNYMDKRLVCGVEVPIQ